MSNLAYWITHRLDPKILLGLHGITRGFAPMDEFIVAALIAHDLVDWNQEERTLTITEKGYDCLEFHNDDLCRLPQGSKNQPHAVKV